jgi:hypothetical protein
MDCLRSFSLGIDFNRTYTNTATQIKNWGVVGNYHFVIEDTGLSQFNIQGFKRIDIYGANMSGYIQTTLGANDGAIVEDFTLQMGIQGQFPLVGGFVTVAPNDFSLRADNPQYNLSKYDSNVTFATPFTGCTGINFGKIKIQGNNGETLNSINLDVRLQVEVFYRFEGE